MNEKLSSNSAPWTRITHGFTQQKTKSHDMCRNNSASNSKNWETLLFKFLYDAWMWIYGLFFFNQNTKKKRRQNCKHMISALKKLHKHTLKCSVNGYFLSPCIITWLIFVLFSVKCLLPLDCTPLRVGTISSRLLLFPSTRAKAHTYVWLNR